jgi:hypothetical protein
MVTHEGHPRTQHLGLPRTPSPFLCGTTDTMIPSPRPHGSLQISPQHHQHIACNPLPDLSSCPETSSTSTFQSAPVSAWLSAHMWSTQVDLYLRLVLGKQRCLSPQGQHFVPSEASAFSGDWLDPACLLASPGQSSEP